MNPERDVVDLPVSRRFARAANGRFLNVIPVALLAACAGATVQNNAATSIASRFPESGYILGRGESREGRTSAEANARARISEQIDLAVQVEIRDRQQHEGGRDYQSVLVEVSQSSRFQRAELMRIVPESITCHGPRCEVLAVLDRGDAIAALTGAYERAATAFREAANQAMRTPSIAPFSARLRDADSAFRSLAPLAFQMRAIGRRDPPGFAEDEGRMRSLVAERVRRLSAVRITVVPHDVPQGDWSSLGGAIVDAFGVIGVAASTGIDCTSGLAFVVEAPIECSASYLGPKCTIDLRGVLSDCTTRAELAPVDFSAAKLTGAHSREETLARRDAVHKVTAGALAPVLRARVMSVLPVQ